MRFVRAVAVAAVVGTVAIGVATFGFGAPALAAASFTVDHTTVTYVPTIGSPADATQDYTVTGDDTTQDFHLRIESDAPAVAPKPAQGPGFTCTASGAIDCAISGVGGTNPLDLRVVYSGAALNNALGQARSKTYTTKATLTSEPSGTAVGTITSHILVRPSADLDVSGTMNVRAVGTGAVLEFNVQNRGPSGSATTNVVVTGFRATPTGLPGGCTATGNAVTCTYHAQVTVDDSRSLSIPITAAEAGCNYTVRVSGAYPDPKTGNNTHTFRNPSLPCGGPTPTATPTTGKPTPSLTPSSTPPSVPPTPAPSETDSLATIPGGQAGSGAGGDSTGILLIAVGAGGLLVALGLALAYRAMRRP